MAKTGTILRVFVASPSDVADERIAIDSVIRELNQTWSRSSGIFLDLIKWETHSYPGVGEDSQAVINREIPDDYDIFIGIMWTRFGTPTTRSSSGTEEEFNRALRRFSKNPDQIRIMFYFKNAPISPLQIDPVQISLVQQFQQKISGEGTLYWPFISTDEFAQLVRIHLSRVVQDYGQGWGTQALAEQGVEAIAATQSAPDNVVPTNDSDEEIGFFDIFEGIHDNSEVFLELMNRITEATENIGRRFTERTQELNELQSSDRLYIKQIKRVSNRAAEDLSRYAALMETEVPVISKTFSTIIEPIGQAVAIAKDYGALDVNAILQIRESIGTSKKIISETQASLWDFKDIIASIPRTTTAMNQARKRAVSILSRLNEEMTSSVNILSELDKALSDLSDDGSSPS